jgi:hypothetical protein
MRRKIKLASMLAAFMCFALFTPQAYAELKYSYDEIANTVTKENLIYTYYRDADADGYGDSTIYTQSWAKPTGYVLDNTDCNDGDPLAYPGSTAETCDGIDRNCDGISALNIFDNFDTDLGNWNNVSGDDIDWTRDRNSTPSGGTGPYCDHTSCSDFGYYMYIEASNNYNKSAYLESVDISLNGISNPQLSFWYHMYGSDMGELYVDVYNGGVWNEGISLLSHKI